MTQVVRCHSTFNIKSILQYFRSDSVSQPVSAHNYSGLLYNYLVVVFFVFFIELLYFECMYIDININAICK